MARKLRRAGPRALARAMHLVKRGNGAACPPAACRYGEHNLSALPLEAWSFGCDFDLGPAFLAGHAAFLLQFEGLDTVAGGCGCAGLGVVRGCRYKCMGLEARRSGREARSAHCAGKKKRGRGPPS